MKQNTVELTAELGLCSSCGMCKNICPVNSISWIRIKGMFYPKVDKVKCVECGACKKICPGLVHSYGSDQINAEEAATGKFIMSYNAWSRNPETRHISASGGVVSTLVETLLLSGIYDVAFCVDTYLYDDQIKTRDITSKDIESGWLNSDFPKSRYLSVSHENAVAYIKANREKKVIFIGTSCAVRGFLNVIEHLNLDRKQYLIIGLFCDKVFNYNIYEYFHQEKYCQGKQLKGLHFKNKESGGWPGNMKLMFTDGTSTYLDKKERGNAKEYFMPERCLYCIDKLNAMADISLGDNYTKTNSSELGSNSIIVRTEQGMNALKEAGGNIELHDVDIEDIKKAQYLEGRLNNFYFGILKGQNIDICLNEGIKVESNANDYERAWKNQLRMLRAGEAYHEDKRELQKQITITEKKSNPRYIGNILERGKYFIKRKMK